MYEQFRTEVAVGLQPYVAEEKLDDALNVIDVAASNYEFKRKETALTVVGGIPEAVKIYIASKITQGLSKATLYGYLKCLEKFFTTMHKPMESITTPDVRAYLHWYQQQNNISDRSKNQIKGQLNCFFGWCMKNDILKKNPCELLEPIKFYIKPREAHDDMQLAKMRASCETPREKAVINLLYTSGLRVSELCDLEIRDIDFSKRAIIVRHGKGNKYRVTYFTAETEVALRMYLESRTDSCPYVIVNERDVEKHGVGKKTIETIVHKVGDRAGIERSKAIPHCLRHTFCTTLLENGCPIQYVQRMMGHAKISTTMIYASINDDDVRHSHAKYAI